MRLQTGGLVPRSPEKLTLQKTNHSLRLKMSRSDPHFSRLWDGTREPGYLEGGKMHDPICAVMNIELLPFKCSL